MGGQRVCDRDVLSTLSGNSTRASLVGLNALGAEAVRLIVAAVLSDPDNLRLLSEVPVTGPMRHADAIRQLFPPPAESPITAAERVEWADRSPSHTYTRVDPRRVCVLATDDRPLEVDIRLDAHGEPVYSFMPPVMADHALVRIAREARLTLQLAYKFGYSYRRIPAPPMPEWMLADGPFWATWKKVPVIHDTVESSSCDWTLFYDSDSTSTEMRRRSRLSLSKSSRLWPG